MSTVWLDVERNPVRVDGVIATRDAPPSRGDHGGNQVADSADREGLCGCITPRHVGPVDELPERGHEVSLLVLVLQVERVLPGVKDQQRDRAVAEVALVV